MKQYHPDPHINGLFHLLDDENEGVAVTALAELLDLEPYLGDAPGIVQECGNALARKRIHQLQAAITIRRRRRGFRNLLRKANLDIGAALIEVHLQWYDNDSLPELEKVWQEFLDSAEKFHANSLEQISYFMRKRGMAAAQETASQPELYCIGAVLESNLGSAALLCCVAMEIAARSGLPVRVVRILGDFALLDDNGNFLFPLRDWQIIAGNGVEQYDFWEKRALLKFASAMLFSHAVTSDSFRYIQTIAQALIDLPDGELPETLPYPYCPAEDPEDQQEESGDF